MENRIPLPTDNIFKFYALFGLLLFVFSCGSLIYACNMTNDIVFRAQSSMATGQVKDTNLFQGQIKLANENLKFYTYALGVLMGIGCLLMFYGFGIWHRTIQPIQDEMLRLQLEKLRLEVEELRPKTSVATVETEQEV